MTMATTTGNSSSSSPIPSTASTLWAHLLNPRGPSKDKANPTQLPSHAQLTPQDKAGTSTRILLHDTQARLEKFSERANSIFVEIEASRRELVRVREEVESAHEKELDAIAQLINRCQSSLQRTIGEPAQARDATITQASLTVTTERLHALEEKLNSKLDALTTLLQTQTQLSQSLQEQFSHAQTQQSRVLELLAPLHSILQSVPLHINIARNAVLEKIPEGCRCRCTGYRSDPSIPSTATCCRTPLSKEDAKLSLGARKKRRISFDTPHFDPNNPPIFGYQDQPVAVEDHHTPLGIFAREPGETSASAQPQRIDTVSAVQTASGVKRGNDAVTRARDHLLLRNALSESVNARLATRQSVISRGIVPSVSALETPYASSDGQNFSNAPRVPAAAVPGKRFILLDDDDDDDEPLN